jgi:hypothetical protein
MTTGAFALCAKSLMKLTPDVDILLFQFDVVGKAAEEVTGTS